ncbi:ferredoxin family protein [Acetobacter sp.]|uniref:4Fe-4S dicluster domain-containing protein n=1 Tax=Acetobacter sp. TaxID=440 RepID=UPI0039EA495B
MITEILPDRCNSCNVCVVVCPDHVLDMAKDGQLPVIARPDQCQTCFLCELYCPEDAIYVAVDVPRSELKNDPLGNIRRDYGWAAHEEDPLKNFWQLGSLLREGVMISSARYALQQSEDKILEKKT